MKVRRLRTDCCGMKKGEIYKTEEVTLGTYLNCQLPDGTWTGPHRVDASSEEPWFEIACSENKTEGVK